MATCVNCLAEGAEVTCPVCGTVQPVGDTPAARTVNAPTDFERFAAENNLRHAGKGKKRISGGKIFTYVTGALGALVIAAIVVLNVFPFGAGGASQALDAGTEMVMGQDASNMSMLEESYIADHPGTGYPVTAPAKKSVDVGGEGTFTPSGADRVKVIVTSTGYCVVVTNPGVKGPVKYDSGTQSTTSTTPGICG